MISDFLPTGAENAITAKHLCKMLDLTPRDVSAAIERERRAGKAICASIAEPFGYYLAANKAEMTAYCQSLLHRAGEIHKTRRACLKTIDTLPDAQEETA